MGVLLDGRSLLGLCNFARMLRGASLLSLVGLLSDTVGLVGFSSHLRVTRGGDKNQKNSLIFLNELRLSVIILSFIVLNSIDPTNMRFSASRYQNQESELSISIHTLRDTISCRFIPKTMKF